MKISLNSYYVEQSNFTIIIRNKKAIIYDYRTKDIVKYWKKNWEIMLLKII